MRYSPFAVVGLVAIVACSQHGGTTTAPTELVVGVQGDGLDSSMTLHVTTSFDGQANPDETVSAAPGPAGLPHEVKLVPPGGNVGAKVGVRVEGYLPPARGPQDGPPVLVRTAESSFVQGQSMLLQLRLQGQCILGFAGGPPGGPTCTAPQTCIDGRCADDTVLPTDLEPYEPNWASDAPDICKPLNAGPPKVFVGTGQTDYLPLTDGQTVQAELGPQGGHHIWVAVRMQNIKQSGSTTTITSVQPGTGLVGPTTAFVFTFDPDEGGFCKLSGLRYQLDNGGIDYHQFLGKPLDVTVTIADTAGTRGSATAHINVDSTILCPQGPQTCN